MATTMKVRNGTASVGDRVTVCMWGETESALRGAKLAAVAEDGVRGTVTYRAGDRYERTAEFVTTWIDIKKA